MIGDLSDKVPDETPMFRLYTGPDQEPETGVVAAGRGCGELQKPLFVERHFRRAGRQQPWRLAKRLGKAAHQGFRVGIQTGGAIDLQKRAGLEKAGLRL